MRCKKENCFNVMTRILHEDKESHEKLKKNRLTGKRQKNDRKGGEWFKTFYFEDLRTEP